VVAGAGRVRQRGRGVPVVRHAGFRGRIVPPGRFGATGRGDPERARVDRAVGGGADRGAGGAGREGRRHDRGGGPVRGRVPVRVEPRDGAGRMRPPRFGRGGRGDLARRRPTGGAAPLPALNL